MIDLDNPELQNALQIIQFTRRSLFLTGKAGTGKSTFLRYIAANTKKKHIILAPTGIAAINAGGSTLHSFFKLPFHPLLPNDSMYSVRNIRNTLKYNSEKIKIIREVELIIMMRSVWFVPISSISWTRYCGYIAATCESLSGASSCFWWAISSSWSLW